jgi:4-oxalocrotonate tautomerase family enzyme
MPLVHVRLFEEELDDETVKRLIASVTDAVCSSTRESLRPAVWVIVEGVPARLWGLAGEPAVASGQA